MNRGPWTIPPFLGSEGVGGGAGDIQKGREGGGVECGKVGIRIRKKIYVGRGTFRC
jgi:hypothetical protein